MKISEIVALIFIKAASFAKERKHEYVTPEHILHEMSFNENFKEAFEKCLGDVEQLRKDLEDYLDDNLEGYESGEPEMSYASSELLSYAAIKANSAGKDEIELSHILDGILNLEDSYALYYILSQDIEKVDLLAAIGDIELTNSIIEEDLDSLMDDNYDEEVSNRPKKAAWEEFVTCLNDKAYEYAPLIGREKELERTMQILCRRYKNNPIHIGEAGVGKTAITMGLATLINEDRVPERLKGAKIFSLDLGDLLAGTQYRGDFEKRFKAIMEGVSLEEKPVIYIDEIHNIVGAGAINGGSFDASNMLKPYLAEGKVRFIGATTYDEYNKHFAKNKSLLRRFQNIDIKEPSIEESVEIIEGLKSYYESFHGIKYTEEAIKQSVILSDKYITDRYLPDKAIDLIDEAAAYRVMNPIEDDIQIVDLSLIEEVLSKITNVPKQTVEMDEVKELLNLDERLKNEVFGQEEATKAVVNAIKLSRAGLNEDNKPVASMLFVGPTGVGKTEIAKVLASSLNVELIRFDMSEYAEKHTVAKLIGAPAGYVGYEEGGLLTDAVKKNPYAVLLLDEIEKAHSDIFNILLQVMDYATLTDNQGRKTDFRNIILIMTSNAGASNVGKSLIGFGERSISKSGIDEAVKKTFTPEFRNRLSKVVVFNNLTEEMSEKIVMKQFKILNDKLANKNIEIVPSKELIKYIVAKGTSQEYGAREIVRIINLEIKSKLVDKILFDKKEDKIFVDFKDGEILLKE
ncbi:MAG: AAA family ATPase [Sarcina sp.]